MSGAQLTDRLENIIGQEIKDSLDMVHGFVFTMGRDQVREVVIKNMIETLQDMLEVEEISDDTVAMREMMGN